MTDTQALDLAAAADLSVSPSIDVTAVLDHLVNDADAAAFTAIGYPGAVDVDYREVIARLGGRLWNNIGDPFLDAGGVAHTRVLERAVIAWVADLLGMPADDRWGYVSAGGTEGNLSALHAAYRRYPTARIYHSTAAHYSIPKIVRLIRARSVAVDTDPHGEMDYEHLAAQLRIKGRRRSPAIVIATAGTTFHEAVDDTSRIRTVLDEHGVAGHVHVDAALSGIPLALDGRLRLDDASDLGSVAISGHKFFGTPRPCGVVLMRDSLRTHGSRIAYTNTHDTTIGGSRCGLAAALLWHAIAGYGAEGHRWRVSEARSLAAYAVEQINATGWSARRHPHAFTVVMPTPPEQVRRKWLLATEPPYSRLICMPGVRKNQIDAFVADLAAAITVPIPRPRTPQPPEAATAC
ncbi:histidine decarboxylase [Micromonospora andamanensis]|uniref:Histidine decarboxylase n=1 Tax=Micromonospora andamanensis TaxID=1287068 RepID=A0ABQ4HS35_9ACTN|nr:histidine decarboxylase [Micromonospora andamanensis]GIJ08453.1 histidine decarboxylase [Micromonospora andamanensis]